MATWGPGGRGGMHTEGVMLAGLPGTFYSQGLANSTAGEHDLQLAEDQIPVLASGTPALRDSLKGKVEHPAKGIIVGKAGPCFS